MNGRSLTDAQIAQALRAHLPEAAPPGLRERVFDGVETAGQLRSLPSLLGALSDADPVARRRSLLIAAALLLAVAVASAAAVGAWRLLQQDPVDKLSLEPPADVPAFVLSSYERLPQLPPVAFSWHDTCAWPDCGPAKGRVYVDRSGTVRFDQFVSADATESASYRILRPDHRISGVDSVGSDKVWIEPGHEAIGEDPRVFLLGILSTGDLGSGCEVAQDEGENGDARNWIAPAGWRYVGVETVAGRLTHRVSCGGGDLWIDIETRLILRMREPLTDDAGQPIPGQFATTEVTEIVFAEQPATLFQPPQGLQRISAQEYTAYICERGLPNALAPGISDCPSAEEPEATPPSEPSPTPTPTVRPDANDCAVAPGSPSQPIGPLAWTKASLKEDWPAPVRPEPAGGGSVQPMPLQYLDPVGDNESTTFPCVDIQWVLADTSEVQLKLVSKPPPWSCPESRECSGVDPAEQWIAYGVVTDEDRDGVPDWRYGVDNMPAGAAEKGPPIRGWRTNLHTGQTDGSPEHWEDVWLNGGGFNAGLPPDGEDFEPDAIFRFGGKFDTTQGMQAWGFELDMPFYTWASVIVDGRVVATDYAPDSGWLVATPGVALTPPRFAGGTYVIKELGVSLGFEHGGSLPLHVSMTVPHDWTVEGPWSRGPEAGNTRLEFGVIGHPWDGCPDTTEPTLGPSFDDLVTYLADLPRIDILQTTDVTIGGHRGKYLKYRPVDKWFDCFSASPIHTEPRDNEAWIVDVDGVRVEIAVVSDEPLSEAVRSEVLQIVESIHFER
jgi:hypothetical protein